MAALERQYARSAPGARWRYWRPLTEEEIWRCQLTEGVTRSTPAPIGRPDRFYEETTALVRVPAASNWPFGRHRTKVKAWRDGQPSPERGQYYNLHRERGLGR
jgi:hypothetical protein